MANNNEAGDNPPNHKNGPDREARDASGRFRRGHGGRKPGCRNKTTALVERLISGEAEEIVRGLIEKAKRGNTAAGAALLRVLIGPARERSAPLKFRLPTLSTAGDCLVAIQTIAEGVASGRLDADSAKILTGLVGEFRSTLTVVDQDRRLTEIEERLNRNGPQ